MHNMVGGSFDMSHEPHGSQAHGREDRPFLGGDAKSLAWVFLARRVLPFVLGFFFTKASCQAWLKLLFANEVRIGGPGGGRFKTDHFEALPQLNRVASVVDFEADVPGGNWVTVGFDSPPGPSSDVHWGHGKTCIGGHGNGGGNEARTESHMVR